MRRLPMWKEALLLQEARLREPLWWFPFLALISFALILLLTGHILFGTNPRMGNPADIITFPSETRRDSSIWLSMTPIGDEIVVTTGDRKVFRWPQNVRDMEPLRPLQAYLKAAAQREIESSAVSNEAFEHQTTVVIATDQRLKFLHVRPLLYAFAEAGISQYAFETQNPGMATAANDAPEAAHGATSIH